MERNDCNPWSRLHEELGFGPDISSVTVYAGPGFCNIENHGGGTTESLLVTIVDSMANYGCISLGQSVVVLAPEHAKIIGDSGWTKSQVQEFLFERATRPVEGMQAVGKFVAREHCLQGGLPDIHRGLVPQDILLTVGAVMQVDTQPLSLLGAAVALP